MIALLGGPCAMLAPAAAQEAACAPVMAVEQPPPPLPAYEQPALPGPGYLWSPGYWSWDEYEGDYAWVPGTWVLPPRAGLLWTPGYWAWFAGGYVFHPGYWGEHVGFYGGINYGFGYSGAGYEGGRWDRGQFFYNSTVNNLRGVSVRNVYQQNIVVNQTVTNVSYNGGRGGIEARPTAVDRSIARQPHFAPTPEQRRHVEIATRDRSLFQRENSGRPPVAATARAGDLKGPGIVRSRPVEETPVARPELKDVPVDATRRPPQVSPVERNAPGSEERKVAPNLENDREQREARPIAPDDHARTEPQPRQERREPPREEMREPRTVREPQAAPMARPEPMRKPGPETERRPEPGMRSEPRGDQGVPLRGASPAERPRDEERRPEQR
ncbi:hypothetical protein [Bradyrhizobium sp. B120]|uniref:hypothetical protein n=1 Tax=Bradyrhizobium sp. B120 TaxID=3410088 RepID=UPI003B982382